MILRIVALVTASTLALSLNAATISTIIGDVDEQNPIILDLLNTPAMQRLKLLDQSGPTTYFIKNFPSFTRYDHSLGVYALLKRYNAPAVEQIAGLMHDASHTAFSHVADHVFQSGEMRTESYQDTIHTWFLSQMHIDDVLSSYEITVDDISPKNPHFTALEQNFPDMNADRIEYNLHAALVLNDLDKQEIEDILNNLHFEDNKWFFSDAAVAKKFAKLSTYYTRSVWGSAQGFAVYSVTSATIKYAIQQQIISKDDLHFGNDQQIIKALRASKDPYVRKLLAILSNIDKHYVISNDDKFDIRQPVKMRGIDPLVQHDSKLQRLSDISHDFKGDLIATSRYCQQGVALKFINIKDEYVLDLLRKSNV